MGAYYSIHAVDSLGTAGDRNWLSPGDDRNRDSL